MGLLGNVAECPHLRHRLMKPEYIQRFTELLDSESDGIEVSYNAAGILSHIGKYLHNYIYLVYIVIGLFRHIETILLFSL